MIQVGMSGNEDGWTGNGYTIPVEIATLQRCLLCRREPRAALTKGFCCHHLCVSLFLSFIVPITTCLPILSRPTTFIKDGDWPRPNWQVKTPPKKERKCLWLNFFLQSLSCSLWDMSTHFVFSSIKVPQIRDAKVVQNRYQHLGIREVGCGCHDSFLLSWEHGQVLRPLGLTFPLLENRGVGVNLGFLILTTY